MGITSILDPVLMPLASFSPFLTVAIIAFIFSLLITLITKFTTNQPRLKEIKQELNKLKEEAKAHKDDPKKVMEINKKMMKLSGENFKANIRTSIWTILPALLILGWLSANFAYTPINPDEQFILTVNFEDGSGGIARLNVPDGLEVVGDVEKEVKGNSIDWKLKGDEGSYLLELEYNNKFFTKDLLITSGLGYKEPVKTFKNDVVKSISTNNEKLLVINFFGLRLGWFWAYLILSIIFMPLLKKTMKVH